jgi:hypothetical protein
MIVRTPSTKLESVSDHDQVDINMDELVDELEIVLHWTLLIQLNSWGNILADELICSVILLGGEEAKRQSITGIGQWAT